MRKLFFAVAVSAALAATPLFAQEAQDGDGSLYYVKVPIVKIYPYSKGYVITYQVGTTGTELDTVYIPDEWFKPKTNKGVVVNVRPGGEHPNMTVYYAGGAFERVKLYIREDRRDPSWGYMPLQQNLDDKFANVTDVPLKFLAATDVQPEAADSASAPQ